MKKGAILILSFLVIISAAIAADKDSAAVEFVKTLIARASGENSYTSAIRFFQYTSTTAKNNPSSYVLSKWGKEAVAESGLQESDKGKYLKALSDRKGARIEKLWKANKEEIFKLLSAQVYNDILKEDVDSWIEFRNRPEYSKMMKKMKAKSRRPTAKSMDAAGAITEWSGYKQLAFWYRREFEKNDKVVFDILQELKAHYAQ